MICLINSRPSTLSHTPVYTFKVIQAYPHDQNNFTEGLVFENGFLFESTGINGYSTLRKVDLETGRILAFREIPNNFFGEGIAIYKDEIIQLTYRSHIGFVYNKENFKLLKEFHYYTEGWGLTYDGNQLIMSDGTARLYFIDPESFKLIRWVEVRDDRGPVKGLNALEYIKGEIYANVYPTQLIAKISPQTGRVIGWINLEGILNTQNPISSKCSLNGIAFDVNKNRLFVTGKFYPKVFEIELVPLNNN